MGNQVQRITLRDTEKKKRIFNKTKRMNVIAFLMENKPDSAKIHQIVDVDSNRKVHDFRYLFFSWSVCTSNCEND